MVVVGPGASPSIQSLTASLDQLAESLMLTDAEGTIQHVNPQFERVTGYSREEVVGLTPRILKSGAHPPAVYQELWAQLLQGLPFRFIFTNQRKDGSLYEEGVLISPLRNAEGEITHFLSLGRIIDQFRQTYDVYTLLANSSPIGMYVLRDGKFFFVNAEFQRMTGYAAEELIGKDYRYLALAEDKKSVTRRMRSLQKGPSSKALEYRLVDKNGGIHWVLETLRSAQFRGLQAVAGNFVACSSVDITDRKSAETGLKEALSLYSATVESNADAILVCSPTGEIVAHNSRFLDFWHLTLRGASELKASDVYPAIRSQLREEGALQRLIDEGLQQPEGGLAGTLDLKTGQVLEVYSRPRLVEGVAVGRVWSFRDVTERQLYESSLSQMASYDTLTGLLNRRRFQEEVELAISRDGQGAVLFMDLDDFKAINDSLGHSAGDEFLRSLGQCLSDGLRLGDVLARLGGDEFAVLLKDTSRQEAVLVARRLLHSVQQLKVIYDGHPVSCTLSIGGALYPNHGNTVDELVGHADMAMYQVKQSGRNNLHIFDSSRDGAKTIGTNRVLWKRRILEGLDENRFLLYSQPIYDLKSGERVCHELLLRLRESNGTLIPPNRFLHIAESSGLIGKIDSWVAREVLILASLPPIQAANLQLSMNLSARALANDDLLEEFRRGVSSQTMDPSRIWLEITETAAVSDLRRAQRFLRNVKSMGFRIALDDFGAGFSSFSQLKNLPIDYLKIDGSFIKDLSRSREDQHFVKAIAEVAAGLGIDAVAEFVEEAETVELLKQFGVAYGQGYYLGYPEPVSDLMKNLSAA